MDNLALLYYSQSRYEEAEPLHLKCLDVSRVKLGEDHPKTLSSMNNLAMLYKSQGRYEEAESLYLKCLDVMRVKLGEDHPNTLTSMNNLAYINYWDDIKRQSLCI
jgi:tetratricopeptide (TPR) repeat protein